MAIKFLSGLNLSNVTAGSILKLDSNGNIVAAVAGTDYSTSAGLWTEPTAGTLYTNKKVGIGYDNAGAKLHVYEYQTTTPKLLIEDGNTGDASMQFKISTQQYTMGIDNSDGDKFKISAGSTFTTSDLVFTSDGKLGIGTNAPSYKMHVEGDSVYVTGGTSNGKWMRMYTNDSWAYLTTNVSKYYFNAELRVDGGKIGSYNESLQLATSGTTRMTLDGTSGNAGINTLSPETKLHIYEASAAPVLLTLHNYQSDINPNGTQGNFIDFKMTDGNATFTPQARIGMLVKDSDGDGGIPSEGSGHFVIYTGEGTDSNGNGTLSEHFRITDKGNIGIGTSEPSYKLHVEGNVGITEYLQHKGDNNTYLRFSTDLIRLAAGGVEMIRLLEDATQDAVVINEGGADVDFRVESDTDTHAFFVQGSDGYAGFGTSTPNTQLHVDGTITVTGSSLLRRYVSGWSNATTHDVLYNGWTETLGDYVYLKAQGNSTSGHGMMLVGDNVAYIGRSDVETGAVTGLDQTWATFKNGGVGIGTTSPAQKLHVKGDIRADFNNTDGSAYLTGYGVEFERGTNYLRPRGTDGTQTLIFGGGSDTLDWNNIQFKTSDYINFRMSGSDVFRINSSGNVGIGTTSPSEALHIYRNAASAEIRLQNNTISSYIRSNTDNLNFYVSNGEKMRITQAGNVGIGTTSPGGKLHLEGNFESGKALVIKGTYGTDTEYYFRTHGTNSEYLALYAAGTRVMNFNSGKIQTYQGLEVLGGEIGTNSSNHLVIGSSVQIGQGDEDPVIEFKYGTTSLGKIDQFGDIHAGGFKVSGTTGFLKSDGTVDTTTYANGNDYLALAGGTMTGDLTIPAKIIHSGDTNTYFLFGTDTITLTAGGSSGISVESGIVKSLQDFVVTGGETFALGERAEGDDNGRTVLIEGTANGSSGEGSGRIFFTEHNSTDASADKYGLSLYYEGDPNAALPSGFQPNTGNATWSLRRHNNSINGAAIMSGSRDNSNVTFGGNLYVPNVIYHTGDTNTYMQFHAADQWRVVTGGSERLEVNNTYTTVANDFWAEDKSHAGNQNWKTKTYIRAVGVEGGSIADKWVHLTTVDIDAAYDKAALKFKIHGYDDVSCGTENIDVLYENGGSVQETHRLDWYSTDGTANLFKAVKSTHSGSNLAHSYELWVQMAGDWRDTFTVEVETWTDEAGFITYSEAVGQVTAPSGDTNDQSKTSREWYTKNTTIYADGTALQTQSQADNRYLQLTGGTVSGAVTLGAQLTLSSFGTGVLRVDAGSVSVDTSNYLTSMPANSTVTSVTFGGVKVEEASDRPGLLEINRDGTDTWSGIMTKFSGTAEWALMGNETSFGLYDDQQNEWAWRYVENSYFEAYNDGSVKLQTASNGVKILNVLELGNLGDTNGGVLKLNGTTANKQAVIKCTNGNLHIDSEDGNALYLNYYEGTSDNIIFGNGNGGASGAKVTSSGVVHATSVEVAGNLSVRNITARDIVSAADRTYSLGTDANRWAVVFCETLDSAGQHESKLQNPEGETPISEYETGTVLVWKGGKNVPCTKAADHMRMGIAVKGIESPLVQGAEPVLCTGEVKEGDYLVTSTTEGHAEAISPEFMRQHMLFDCVIGKALEDGAGESHLVKTWINI